MTRLSIEEGSGNVFHDPGLHDAQLRLAKAELARHIRLRCGELGWSQSELGRQSGESKGDMSELCRGTLTRFSLERLIRIATAAGITVQLTASSPAPSAPRHRPRHARP